MDEIHKSKSRSPQHNRTKAKRAQLAPLSKKEKPDAMLSTWKSTLWSAGYTVQGRVPCGCKEIETPST